MHSIHDVSEPCRACSDGSGALRVGSGDYDVAVGVCGNSGGAFRMGVDLNNVGIAGDDIVYLGGGSVEGSNHADVVLYRGAEQVRSRRHTLRHRVLHVAVALLNETDGSGNPCRKDSVCQHCHYGNDYPRS